MKESDIVESKKLVATGVLVKRLELLNDVCLRQAGKIDKLEKMVFNLYANNLVSPSEEDVYVVWSEKAGVIDKKCTSFEEALTHRVKIYSLSRTEEIYGKCRIARLVLLDEEK